MDHNSNEIKGQKCEVCGMDATVSAKDENGVTHFYCDGHAPKKEEHKLHGMEEHKGHEEGGYNRHAGHSVEAFRRKFWISFLLTIPVVLYSDLAKILGLSVHSFPGSIGNPLIFSSVVF